MKRLYSAIILLCLILAFGYYKEQQPMKISRDHIPEVGILQLTEHPALDAIHHGIIQGLKESGFQPGKNIKIDFQNAENDQSNLKTMSTKFANENVDLSIGIATPSAQVLANTVKNRPLVLGAITDPKSAGLVDSNQKPGRNTTGVSDLPPMKQQIDLIKQIMPHMKTLGIIYTSSDDSATSQYQRFTQLCKQEGIRVKGYSIANTNDLNQVATQMVQNVDAVYVPNDNTVASAIQTLVAVANKRNVPIFPTASSVVKNGGLATYGLNQFKLGVETGKVTAQILKGKNASNMPIQTLNRGDLAINLNQAKKLGINIPQSLIQKAERQGVIYK
ncbi:tryptophan ABC transporter substrate-binding protein [Apilactobacillus timberlakei]|uniref:tryptophan ABC transporter substrate-binding protein n=1 Tax=Apilactobacillus timberlakei TaxID=2008380 RepID=UPI001126B04C|nr:tryptophan ABC transporter substrate-binding protein [Apilactobacillus timberlakei]TPR18294.1 peptide ABC transporter substrate-binding protein [Apilactobacillus timberlakei]